MNPDNLPAFSMPESMIKQILFWTKKNIEETLDSKEIGKHILKKKSNLHIS